MIIAHSKAHKVERYIQLSHFTVPVPGVAPLQDWILKWREPGNEGIIKWFHIHCGVASFPYKPRPHGRRKCGLGMGLDLIQLSLTA